MKVEAMIRGALDGGAAGIVMGARVPIVLTSRADPPEARLAATAIGSRPSERMAGIRQELSVYVTNTDSLRENAVLENLQDLRVNDHRTLEQGLRLIVQAILHRDAQA